MPLTLDQISAEAMHLPPASRSQLAEKLVESLDFPVGDEIQTLWAAEAIRRRDDVRSGKVAPIPASRSLPRCAASSADEVRVCDSAALYAAARLGLGAEFTREVESVIERICDAPERWKLFEQDVRRCLTRRFPFAVLFIVEADYVLIIAVMHGSREPGYWRHRIE